MKPDISVIMPAFNTAPWIGTAIESVLLQAGPSWELLVVDDGSADASPAIAGLYAALDARVRALPNEGAKGAGGARNTGLKHARGAAVAFLDSDDAFLPGALAALHGRLLSSGQAVVRGQGAIFCARRWQADMQPPPFAPDQQVRPGSEKPLHPRATFWLHLFRADFLADNNIVFAENLRGGEDYHFLCHAYALIDELPVVERVIHLYRYNHKRDVMTVEKAQGYLDLAFNIRAIFTLFRKEERIVPCIEANFLNRWLRCLHAVARNGEVQGRAYIDRCLTLFAGREGQFAPALRRGLNEASADFFKLWAGHDTAGLLQLLSRQRAFHQDWPFLGIERSEQEAGSLFYALPRRGLNLLRNKLTRRALRHFALLAAQSRRRAGPKSALMRSLP